MRLTYYQISRILFAERDKQGQVIVKPKHKPGDPKQRFFTSGLRRGLPRWLIEEKWQEQLKKLQPQQATRAPQEHRQKPVKRRRHG
jgi:hypothetical protein